MATRCKEGWRLFMQLCDRYADDDRREPGSEYERTLEAYRLHHGECDQCHGRTVELTELARGQE